ncbi:MAG: hypothetical protein A3K10_12565 [Bacteroidetes bacterium RIFCSPLOWO2_12_FULL_31_6]|nr:MAG: hypothetical protein A3K10_12565 [Bacteroidetes bacterium RIFCSPLOWO2_12_FULL_31_6]
MIFTIALFLWFIKKMFKKINLPHLFLFFLFLAILPYCYLSFFCQPIAEDFGFASYYQQSNFFELLKNSYCKMNGRYIANILMYLNPISFNNYLGYKLVPFLMIVLMVIGNILMVKEVFYFLPKIKQLIMAMMLSLLYFQNMPIISEGLYWYTAAVIYQGGIICSVFYITLFIKLIRNKNKNTLIGKTILTGLLFITCGFNEVLTLLICFSLLIATIIVFLNKNDKRKGVLLQFIFSIIFASLMVFSPGNIVREAMYQNNNNISHSFFFSLLQIIRFSFYWIFSLALISASIIYLSIHQQWKERSLWLKNSFYLNKWVSLLMLFTIIFICVFPAYWATGILGQHRTLNVAYFFFLMMWFINLSVWFNAVSWIKKVNLSKKLINGVSLLFILGILFMGNGYHALIDIFSGSAQEFNTQLNKRHETLLNATKTNPKKIIFPPTVKPKTLFVIEISKDSKFWTNRGYNTFFQLDSIDIYVDK